MVFSSDDSTTVSKMSHRWQGNRWQGNRWKWQLQSLLVSLSIKLQNLVQQAWSHLDKAVTQGSSASAIVRMTRSLYINEPRSLCERDSAQMTRFFHTTTQLVNQNAARYTRSWTLRRHLVLVVAWVLLSVSSAAACSFQSGCSSLDSDRQCQALCELYSSMGGAGWSNNSGWGGGSDPISGSWFGLNGIGVNSSAVIKIDISNNNIRGTLPKSLAGLPKLSSLACTEGALSGTIPSSWSDATTLQVLLISGRVRDIVPGTTNKISGTIPRFVFALTALNRLETFGNLLSGTLDSGLSQLTSMERLRLYGSPLSGYIPAGVSSLTALQTIQGYDLKVSGHIPDISTATCITYLSLTGFSSQSSLSGTIEGLLNQIENLNALSILYMENAKFSGTISRGNLHKAVALMVLSKNRLSGLLPIQFSKYPSLKIMHLESNNISGTIPNAFGSLTSLRQIFLGNCSVSGSLPSTLGKSSKLLMLDLNTNKLSGSSSPEFSSWQRLILISLYGNSFDWDLSLINYWKQVMFILFQGMSITGTLPLAMLEANPMLAYLLIGRNKISGTISQRAFKSAIYLSRLLISNNVISGSLPEQQLQHHSSAHEGTGHGRWPRGTHGGVEMTTGFPLSLTTLMANGLKLSGSLPRFVGGENQTTLIYNQQRRPVNNSFTLVSGPCTIDAEGCALSPKFPGQYDHNQECSLRTNFAGWAKTTHFETEWAFDFLYVSYWAYSGDYGVQNFYLPAQTPISFTTDESIVKSGWRICLFEGPDFNGTTSSGHFILLYSSI